MPADVVKLDAWRLKKTGPPQIALKLMGLPARKRMEVILESPDPQSVVAALDVNDFFHTIQEIGPDDSLPLLCLAGIEQLNHLFDIEWWRKDTLKPAKALAWLERLWRSGDAALFEWISKVDFELLVSLFKQWISLDSAPEDIDLIEATESLPPKTFDNFYFWEARYPQFDDLITQLLSVIFETNYSFFKELMNSVLFAPSAEMEETAFHFHRARLEDHGIPDFYDALEIYRAIGPNEFTEKSVIANADQQRPAFALALLPAQDLFARALGQIEDPFLLETLQAETAALANKLIIADQMSPDDSRALRGAVDKTLAYINLGLELRSGGGIEGAVKVLRDNFLEHLFRLAQAEIARIRGRLVSTIKFGWLKNCPGGIKRLDGEWFDMAEELLGITPKISRKSHEESPSSYDFFRTSSDLARAEHFVDIIVAIGEIYRQLTAEPSEPIADFSIETQSEGLTIGMLALTAAANLLFCHKGIPKPLARSAWPEIFPLVQPRAISTALGDWIQGALNESTKVSLARAYFDPILRDYELEMRPFSWQNPPDPEMVRFFVFI
ncbi:MAG: DUF6178 family protein [Syntrophobacteraceae bacterium]